MVYASGGSGTTATIPLLATGATGVSTARYDDWWIYGVDGNIAGLLRPIIAGSYVSGSGIVSVDPGWITPTGTPVIHMTKLFPAIEPPYRPVTNYRTLMNAALRRLNIVREISVPITTSSRIALTTWAAWLTPERVLSVREPSPTGVAAIDSSWRRWRVIKSGTGCVLEFAGAKFASASGNLTVEVVSPAYTYVNGTESAVGYAADTDSVQASVEEVRKATLVEAYHALHSRMVTRPAGNWEEMWRQMEADCRANIPYYDYERPAPAAAQSEVA